MGAVKQQSNIIKMAAREEREGIIYDNPEKFYEFEEEIGSGKMATVKKVKSKTDGKAYAAKMIYFDDDTRFAIREFDLKVWKTGTQRTRPNARSLHGPKVPHLDLGPC